MTKEEREKAIDLLDNLLGMVEDNQDNDYDKALRMSIESLRKEPCADCVNRTTVLTLINDVQRADGFKDYSQYEYLFDNVDKMPMSVPTQKWIPVSEKLPKEGETVLVCYQVQGGIAQSVCEWFDIPNIGIVWSTLCGRTPIAWQTLPKPYRENKGE